MSCCFQIFNLKWLTKLATPPSAAEKLDADSTCTNFVIGPSLKVVKALLLTKSSLSWSCEKDFVSTIGNLFSYDWVHLNWTVPCFHDIAYHQDWMLYDFSVPQFHWACQNKTPVILNLQCSWNHLPEEAVGPVLMLESWTEQFHFDLTSQQH